MCVFFFQLHQLEYQLALKFLEKPDFHTGMQHFIVNQMPSVPVWQYSSPSDVPFREVAAMFATSITKDELGLLECRPEIPRPNFKARMRKWLHNTTEPNILPKWLHKKGDLSVSHMVQDQTNYVLLTPTQKKLLEKQRYLSKLESHALNLFTTKASSNDFLF